MIHLSLAKTFLNLKELILHASCNFLSSAYDLCKQFGPTSKRKECVLHGATFKGKNMLPTGCIFFPLKVAHMGIDINLKGH